MIIVLTLVNIFLVIYLVVKSVTKYYTENYTDNYPELYVSKTSADHISDISKMVEVPKQEICISCDEQKGTHKICMDCIGKMIKENQQEKSLSDKWKEYQDWLNETPEISDEEIEKGADECYPFDESDDGLKGMIISAKKGAWFDAIKWYREQLKCKGNDSKSKN